MALVWKQDYRLSITVNKDRWASSSTLYKTKTTQFYPAVLVIRIDFYLFDSFETTHHKT